jgi:uncharacterized RDD family membrane protein YckC
MIGFILPTRTSIMPLLGLTVSLVYGIYTVDWLPFNTNFSNISAILWYEIFLFINLDGMYTGHQPSLH